MSLFLKSNLSRLIATLVVAITFLHFWVNGPILERDPVLGLEVAETEYSRPKLISSNQEKPNIGFALVDGEEDRRHHYAIVGMGHPTYKRWSLIADPKNNPAMDREVGEHLLEHARELAPEAANLTLKRAVDMYYVEVRREGRLDLLYLENAGGLTRDIKGYAGAITLGVFIELSGRLHSVHHIRSRETPSYLQEIETARFYDQFARLLVTEEHEIDALTGATLSTVAMARSISALIDFAEQSPLSLYLDEDPHSFQVRAVLSQLWIVYAALLTGFFVFAWQNRWRRSRRIISVAAVAGIGFIGFYLNNSFTFVTLLHPFMGVSLSYLMGCYAALVLLSALWDSNTYCKYICPYGNLQRLVSRIFPKIRRGIFLPGKWLRRIRLMFTLVLIGGILLGMRSWSSFEPYPDIFGLAYASAWFWVSLILVLMSAIWPMFWCRVLCPTGAVLDLLRDLVKPSRQGQSTHKISIATRTYDYKKTSL